MQSIDSGFTALAIFALLGYGLGSIPFAMVISRLMGLADPRTYGSGNPGATNVLRTGNKKAAILTLLGDAAKGWLAVWLATVFNGQPDVIALTALTVFLGHLFPISLGFKGGKGVATALGVLLAVEPALGIATLLTWITVAFFFRMSSLAAIASALFAPFYYFILSGVLWTLSVPMLTALVLISLMLVWRHRANIGRIVNGTEPKIGKKTGG